MTFYKKIKVPIEKTLLQDKAPIHAGNAEIYHSMEVIFKKVFLFN